MKQRKRAPRYIGRNHILVPYDPEKSHLQFLLRTTEDCIFEKHYYLDSWTISPSGFILLSDKRIFSFTKLKANPTPKLNWAIPIPEIRDINMMDNGVNILLRSGKNIVFDAHQRTSERIKNAVWKSMAHRKSSAIKQLEYHLVEDKGAVNRELEETRNSTLPPPSPQVQPLSHYDSTKSLEEIASIQGSPASEKTPLLRSQQRQQTGNAPSPQVRRNQGQIQRRRPPPRKHEEEDCCSCNLL